jgi:hypothetical protein
MKKSDHSLDRLLRAATLHRPAAVTEPPFGFTTRVLAGWLASPCRDRAGLETLWFRRAFLCAFAIMAISVSWSYKTDTSTPNPEIAVANYDTSADLP